MKKVLIKIHKGNREKQKTPAPETVPEVGVDVRKNVDDVVNDWISERRANRLLEKIYSDEIISAWKINSSFSNSGQSCRIG
jgi:hypothetical protein